MLYNSYEEVPHNIDNESLVAYKVDWLFCNVLKNRYTGKVGLMEISEFNELEKSLNYEKSSEEEIEEEVISIIEEGKEYFKTNVFPRLENMFQKIENTLKEEAKDITKNIEIRTAILDLERMREKSLEYNVYTTGFLDKIDARIEDLKSKL